MFFLRSSNITRRCLRYGQRLESSTTKRPLPMLDQFLWKEDTIESARVPPTSWYTDPAFLRVELQQTFRNNWLFYGRKEQFKSNSFVAKTVAGEPIVVVRNEADKLVGYYNVCRHHAAQLLDEGEGTCSAERRITCPYHGWQYNFDDGRLAKAVQMKGNTVFKAKEFGLIPVHVDTLGPWVFVNVGESTTGTLLGDQPDLSSMIHQLQQSSYHNLKYLKSASYHIKCNWKVYVDNFLDGGYHIPTAHPILAEELDMNSYDKIASASDNFFLQTCRNKISDNNHAARTSSTGQKTTEHQQEAALYYFHYPSLMINRYGSYMDINVIEPDGPDACRVYFEWYVDESLLTDATGRATVEQCLVDSEQIQVEDIWLCERVQKGLHSSAYRNRVGIYSPHFEAGEYMFHRRLQKDLQTTIAASKRK